MLFLWLAAWNKSGGLVDSFSEFTVIKGSMIHSKLRLVVVLYWGLVHDPHVIIW